MREILFRGKRKDNGEWVEGHYAKPTHYLSEEEIHVIFPLDLTLFPYSEFSSYEEIIPETVGQFTGLTDKNGKKIFEGDILSLGGDPLPHWHDEGDIVEVRYKGCAFDPLDDYDSDCGTAVVARLCEVIGNIHDNPELLNKEN